MWWSWWGAMLVTGLALGCIAAWTTDAARVCMKTIAVPLVLLVARLFFRKHAPPESNIGLVFLDFLILITGAFIGDYLFGMRIGRHGPDGYRQDSVGH